MIELNRHDGRRRDTLRRQGLRQGLTQEQIERQIEQAPGLTGSDPVFDARTTRQYVGGISEMTLWRWTELLDFPAPDFIIGRKKFWRRSTIDAWLDTRRNSSVA